MPPDFVALAADRFTLLCLTVLFFSVQSLREDCFPISSQFVYMCIVLADEPTSLDSFPTAVLGYEYDIPAIKAINQLGHIHKMCVDRQNMMINTWNLLGWIYLIPTWPTSHPS